MPKITHRDWHDYKIEILITSKGLLSYQLFVRSQAKAPFQEIRHRGLAHRYHLCPPSECVFAMTGAGWTWRTCRWQELPSSLGLTVCGRVQMEGDRLTPGHAELEFFADHVPIFRRAQLRRHWVQVKLDIGAASPSLTLKHGCVSPPLLPAEVS